MIATTLSFRLMEMACQSSYPLNSDIASPPGTFALYLSCAAMAKPATRASTTARITPIWTFIRNRLLLLLAALLSSCCGTGVWVIVFSSFGQLMNCCHKRTRSKGLAREGIVLHVHLYHFGARNGLTTLSRTCVHIDQRRVRKALLGAEFDLEKLAQVYGIVRKRRAGSRVIGLYVLSSARREKTCYADGIDQSW